MQKVIPPAATMTRVANAPRSSTTVKLGSRTLSISNMDKVLYPDADFTKGDVIHYYLQIAPVLLPHLKDRPITLKRYPNGVDGMFFYEKRCPSHKPAWVKTKMVPSRGKDGRIDYCLVNDVQTLASIELHTLLSKAKNVQQPTMVVFDLDPGPPAGVFEACQVAVEMRDLFKTLGLTTFVKHSGGKGLHLVVPLNTKVSFDQTKDFAKTVALLFEQRYPKRAVHLMRKDLRAGKVFIDWSQNDEHKTTVNVYSLRARKRPWVSAPLTWKEVETALRTKDVDAIHFEAGQVVARVKRMGDLFEPVLTMKQKLPSALG
jgi:bifunctional non-homologous end joining protein LigD